MLSVQAEDDANVAAENERPRFRELQERMRRQWRNPNQVRSTLARASRAKDTAEYDNEELKRRIAVLEVRSKKTNG